ncbi:MAG: glucose-1-phosphate thymidylyltransferase [Gammaproteobacteria bacterium]|nr:MAG: glucose-1-phosphate thymidylyltransferase [Gammaproteobacteria bacterium]RLA12694.1 MAG: glucose-1-phosphate thymidylyltransferase [Gammaproteobacteria bacterium]RLA17646.1 MAG: glucose-1-phosphate thymidylyltransferase [Gammaproteobacteria bacterium]
MKGIILAGGSGSRLHPLTLTVSKQLLPVYDKPMVYYPLCTLMQAGIREMLVISDLRSVPAYEQLLGDGSQWGLEISYAVQPSPDGLAQAFTLGADFIGADSVCLVLGDNIFYGHGLSQQLLSAASLDAGAVVFGYYVKDPERYGVLTFDDQQRVVDIQEKPIKPASNYAVTGLYFYDNQVIEISRGLSPSARGEYEITDLNRVYLQQKQLRVELLGRGTAWLDTGTHDSLLDAANFIKIVEERQGLKIACPEEIAYRQGWVSVEQVEQRIATFGESSYSEYLRALLEERQPI